MDLMRDCFQIRRLMQAMNSSEKILCQAKATSYQSAAKKH